MTSATAGYGLMPGMILRSHGFPESRPAPVGKNKYLMVEMLFKSTLDVPAFTMVPTVIVIILGMVQLSFVKA